MYPFSKFLVVAALLLGAASISGCLSSSSSSNTAEADPETGNPPLVVTGSVNLKALESEEELLSIVKSYYSSVLDNKSVYGRGGVAASNDGGAEVDMPTLAASDSVQAERTSSGTNLVEANVDEADLVKTDGQFLYVVDHGTRGGDVWCLALECERAKEQKTPSVKVMRLLDQAQPDVELVATIDIKAVGRIRGIYLKEEGGQLIVVGAGSKLVGDDHYQTSYMASYDVNDKESISLNWEFEIEGYINATRSLNGKLYLLTTKNFWFDDFYIHSSDRAVMERNQRRIDELTIDEVLPKAWLNDSAFSAVEATNCIDRDQLYEGSVFNAEMLSILTIPLDDPSNMKGVCTLESSREVYATDQSIYLTRGEYNYVPDSQRVTFGTVIHKFSYTDDSVVYKASARVPGSTGWRSSAFRLSEQGDYLRVVVSDDQGGIIIEPLLAIDTVEIASDSVSLAPAADSTDHRLYILKEDDDNPGVLKEVSVLPNDQQTAPIGKPNEQIYAVRYNGDYAYIVTFEKTDPVYAINLSNPESPFIEGELEIPGYSDYLHPIGNDLLLGIGKEAKMERGITYVQGVKVGLFDISDKSQPAELASYELGKRGSDAPVSHDYHAFAMLTDARTGMHRVAFPVSIHEREPRWGNPESASAWYGWSRSVLKLYEVDDGEVSSSPQLFDKGELVSHTYDEYKSDNFSYRDKPRSVLVDDAIYYISEGRVWSAQWGNPGVTSGPRE